MTTEQDLNAAVAALRNEYRHDVADRIHKLTQGGIMMTGPKPQWLSTHEAAEIIGITSRTLYRFIDEGQLPAYRFGRVIRLKRNEVDSYIESCRIEPGTLEHLYPETLARVQAAS